MKRYFTLLVALMGIATSLWAQQSPLKVVQRQLKNGMTVWINEDHQQPKVMGGVLVKAGARDCAGTGIAHYFEHIMFKGTEHIGTIDYEKEKPWLDSIAVKYDLLARTTTAEARRSIQHDINRLSRKAAEYAIPNEFNTLLARYGGTGINAYTSHDETVYHNMFAPQYLRQWCELYAERFISPVFRLFQSELETVYEEKNRAADNLMSGVLDHAQARIFAGTPYAETILGRTEDLKNPQLSQMRAFYDKYYVANNMALVLCGDIRADEVMPILEETFGKIRSGELPERPQVKVKPFAKGDRMELKVPIPLIKAAGLAYQLPNARHADNLPLAVATALLTNENETGLLDSLGNHNLVLGAAAMTMAHNEAGLMLVGAVPNLPFGSKKKAMRLVTEQIDRLRQGAFSNEALQLVKQSILTNRKTALEDLETRAYKMINLLSQGRTWEGYLAETYRLEHLEKADIMRVAQRYLGDNALYVVKKFGRYPQQKLLQPGYKPIIAKHNGEESAYARQLAAIPTSTAQPKTVDLETAAKQQKLSDLVTLYTVRNPMNDVFNLRLTFRKGTAEEPRLAPMAEYMGIVGTDSLSKQQLGRAFQRLGGSIDLNAGRHSFTVSLTGLDRNLVPTLQLARHLMEHAKADKEKFDELKKGRKVEEKAFFTDNSNIADALLQKIVVGESSEYLTRVSASDMKNMNATMLVDLLKDIQKVQLDIVYSGQLSAEEVRRDVESCLNLDQVTQPYHEQTAKAKAYGEPRVYLFNNPSARQMIVSTYDHVANCTTMADRTRLRLWANYFGGGMSSLMFQHIREFHSYAYSAYGTTSIPSFMRHPDYPSAFVAQLGTQADKTMLAMGVLDSLFRHMPVVEKNIDNTRQSIINAINNSYPSFRTIGSFVAKTRLDGWKVDPDKLTLQALEALTNADVVDFYNRFIQPNTRIWMITGNKKMLDMQELSKYGKVIEVTKEELYH